jgi:hypothetical protein
MKERTNFILDGSSGKDDITDIWFSQNPSAVNQNGTMYSANNQPKEAIDFVYPGYYLPETERKELQLLEPKSTGIKNL